MKIKKDNPQMMKIRGKIASRQKGSMMRVKMREMGNAQATAISVRCPQGNATSLMAVVFLNLFSMKRGISLA